MKLSLTPFVIVLGLTANLSAQTLANYQAEVMSQSPTHYFKLDSSLASAVNGADVLSSFGAGGFTGDVFRNPTNSYFFVNGTDFLQAGVGVISGGGAANSNATAKGSITLLFRALSGPNIGGQRFLFDGTTTASMGTTNNNALALYFENDTATNFPPNALLLRFGDTTTPILQASNIAYGAWYYFALTYDEARVPNKAIWHIGPAGGVLSTGMTTNSGDAVAGEGTGLIIGNRAGFSGGYRNPGSGRIDEYAIWASELSSLQISNQFSKLPQLAPAGATYQQVVVSQIPKYYFKLDNSLVESVGNSLVLSNSGDAGAFTTDLLGNPNRAYSFSATNDALIITNDLINGGGVGVNTAGTGAGTISLQFRMLSDTNYSGQRFIFSAPATETGTDNNALALFLESPTGVNPGSLKIRAGGATFGNSGSSSPENNVPLVYATNLVPNAWYYCAVVYDETGGGTLDVYSGPTGGTLTKQTYNPNNDDSMGNNGPLVIGNRSDTFGGAFRSPGTGVVDEFAVWYDMLTPTDIQAQFAAMSPTVSPKLNIALSAGNVLLSWPASTPSSFVLERTNVLDSTTIGATNWPSAGTATVVGTNYVVTNVLSSGSLFYRLHKP